MKGIHSSGSDITQEDDDPGYLLPRYSIYLSLGFKWMATALLFLMSGWVLTTIKTTRRLHKPHNVFVANLMITSIIIPSLGTVLTTIMVVGRVTGLGDFVACNMYQFATSAGIELYYTFLMISVDKMVAIVYPYKYRNIMTSRVVTYTITASWILAVVPIIPKLFDPGDYTRVAEYGACLSNEGSLLSNLLLVVLPTLISSLLAVIIDAYLAIKAFKINKQIHKETRLSGAISNKVKSLKEKKAAIKRHLKPMITLLVAVLGSTSTGMVLTILYLPVKTMETTMVYKQFMELIFITNVPYIIFMLQPFIYGLYYKQTREAMIKLVNRVFPNCKFHKATVAPQP